MNESIEWLLSVSSPAVKYRTATELSTGATDKRIRQLRAELEGCSESQKWLSRLGASTHIHSSQETAAENCIAKLVAYGLTAESPAFRESLNAVYQRLYTEPVHKDGWGAGILFPFLVAAGFLQEDEITAFVEARLAALSAYVRAALISDSERDDIADMFLSLDEKQQIGVPKKWLDKNVWQPSLTPIVPTCYDFYLFAHLGGHDHERELILKLVSTKRYQRFCRIRELNGSYGWDPAKRYCWSTTTMPYFHGFFGFADASFAPSRFLLYLDLVSRYPGAGEIPWFLQGLQHLEKYRVGTDRYCFPASYVPERKTGYYLYSGSMMGLGETGKKRLEVESTFRMLSMKRNAGVE